MLLFIFLFFFMSQVGCVRNSCHSFACQKGLTVKVKMFVCVSVVHKLCLGWLGHARLQNDSNKKIINKLINNSSKLTRASYIIPKKAFVMNDTPHIIHFPIQYTVVSCIILSYKRLQKLTTFWGESKCV